MKKTLLFIAVMLFVSTSAFSQTTFGLGISGGSKSKLNDQYEEAFNFGINARLTHDFTERASFSGGLTYFFPFDNSFFGYEVTTNYFVINADIQYKLVDEADVELYMLGGVNMAIVSAKVGNNSDSDSEFNFEAGFGINLDVIFLEAKYDANMEQFVGTFGFNL